jgi:hypothetical protein
LELNEIHVDNDGNKLSYEQFEEIIEKLNEIAADNLNEFSEEVDDRAPDFHYNAGKISLYNRMWGTKRNPSDDVALLSESFPEYTFSLIRTLTVTSTTLIGNLENYWKGEFQMGTLIDSYRAEPVVWVSEAIRNWYLDPADANS